MAVYTSGVWTVRAGCADEFVVAWRGLADWAALEFPDAGRPTLLRDRDRSDRFLSFGAWRDAEQVARFREHPGFAERVGRIRELLDGFEPSTLDPVVETGRPV